MQTNKERISEVEREELQRKNKSERPKTHQQYLDAPREVFPRADNLFGVFL